MASPRNLVPSSSPVDIRSGQSIAAFILQDGTRVNVSEGARVTFDYTPSTSVASSIPAHLASPARFGRARATSNATDNSGTGNTRDLLNSLQLGSDADQTVHNFDRSTDASSFCSPRNESLRYESLESRAYNNVFQQQDYLEPSNTNQDYVDIAQDDVVANANGAFDDDEMNFEDIVFPDATDAFDEGEPSSLSARDFFPDPFAWGSAPTSSTRLVAESPRLIRDEVTTSLRSLQQAPGRKTILSKTQTKRTRTHSQTPGRKKGTHLNDAAKRKAAIMRVIGACEYCKEGRRSCDVGTPCRPCKRRSGVDLQDQPCRESIEHSLLKLILSPDVKWHPAARKLSEFFGPRAEVTEFGYEIAFTFGFGPAVRIEVLAIDCPEFARFVHSHMIYPEYGEQLCEEVSELVLPVTFANENDVERILDRHITTFVNQSLPHFHLFRSRSSVMQHVYNLFMIQRRQNEGLASLLRLALKLLVLTHVGMKLETTDPTVHEIMQIWNPFYSQDYSISPCLLRASIGAATQKLAVELTEDLLKQLFQLSTSGQSTSVPVILAVYVIVMLALESLLHHGSRTGRHVMLGDTAAQLKSTAAARLAGGAASATILLNLYRSCFQNCHAVLRESLERGASSHGSEAICALRLNSAIAHAGTLLDKIDGHEGALDEVRAKFDELVEHLLGIQDGF